MDKVKFFKLISGVVAAIFFITSSVSAAPLASAAPLKQPTLRPSAEANAGVSDLAERLTSLAALDPAVPVLNLVADEKAPKIPFNLAEVGHQLISTKNLPVRYERSKGPYTYVGLQTGGEHPKSLTPVNFEGDIEDRCSEEALARRFADRLLEYKSSSDAHAIRDKIEQNIVEDRDTLLDLQDASVRKALKIVVREGTYSEAERRSKPKLIDIVLMSVTEAAQEENRLARKWVLDVGIEIGQALAAFVAEYKDSRFISHLSLSSAVNDRFGRGIVDEDGEDLYTNTIQNAFKRTLIYSYDVKEDTAKKLAKSIVHFKPAHIDLDSDPQEIVEPKSSSAGRAKVTQADHSDKEPIGIKRKKAGPFAGFFAWDRYSKGEQIIWELKVGEPLKNLNFAEGIEGIIIEELTPARAEIRLRRLASRLRIAGALAEQGYEASVGAELHKKANVLEKKLEETSSPVAVLLDLPRGPDAWAKHFENPKAYEYFKRAWSRQVIEWICNVLIPWAKKGLVSIGGERVKWARTETLQRVYQYKEAIFLLPGDSSVMVAWNEGKPTELILKVLSPSKNFNIDKEGADLHAQRLFNVMYGDILGMELPHSAISGKSSSAGYEEVTARQIAAFSERLMPDLEKSVREHIIVENIINSLDIPKLTDDIKKSTERHTLRTLFIKRELKAFPLLKDMIDKYGSGQKVTIRTESDSPVSELINLIVKIADQQGVDMPTMMRIFFGCVKAKEFIDGLHDLEELQQIERQEIAIQVMVVPALDPIGSNYTKALLGERKDLGPKSSSAGITVEVNKVPAIFGYLDIEEQDSIRSIISDLTGKDGLQSSDPWIKAWAVINLSLFDKNIIYKSRKDIIPTLTSKSGLLNRNSWKKLWAAIGLSLLDKKTKSEYKEDIISILAGKHGLRSRDPWKRLWAAIGISCLDKETRSKYSEEIKSILPGKIGLRNSSPWKRTRAAVSLSLLAKKTASEYKEDIISILAGKHGLRSGDPWQRLWAAIGLLSIDKGKRALRVDINYTGLKRPHTILAKDTSELTAKLQKEVFTGLGISCKALSDTRIELLTRYADGRAVTEAINIYPEEELEKALLKVLAPKVFMTSPEFSPTVKFSPDVKSYKDILQDLIDLEARRKDKLANTVRIMKKPVSLNRISKSTNKDGYTDGLRLVHGLPSEARDNFDVVIKQNHGTGYWTAYLAGVRVREALERIANQLRSEQLKAEKSQAGSKYLDAGFIVDARIHHREFLQLQFTKGVVKQLLALFKEVSEAKRGSPSVFIEAIEQESYPNIVSAIHINPDETMHNWRWEYLVLVDDYNVDKIIYATVKPGKVPPYVINYHNIRITALDKFVRFASPFIEGLSKENPEAAECWNRTLKRIGPEDTAGPAKFSSAGEVADDSLKGITKLIMLGNRPSISVKTTDEDYDRLIKMGGLSNKLRKFVELLGGEFQNVLELSKSQQQTAIDKSGLEIERLDFLGFKLSLPGGSPPSRVYALKLKADLDLMVLPESHIPHLMDAPNALILCDAKIGIVAKPKSSSAGEVEIPVSGKANNIRCFSEQVLNGRLSVSPGLERELQKVLELCERRLKPSRDELNIFLGLEKLDPSSLKVYAQVKRHPDDSPGKITIAHTIRNKEGGLLFALFTEQEASAVEMPYSPQERKPDQACDRLIKERKMALIKSIDGKEISPPSVVELTVGDKILAISIEPADYRNRMGEGSATLRDMQKVRAKLAFVGGRNIYTIRQEIMALGLVVLKYDSLEYLGTYKDERIFVIESIYFNEKFFFSDKGIERLSNKSAEMMRLSNDGHMGVVREIKEVTKSSSAGKVLTIGDGMFVLDKARLKDMMQKNPDFQAELTRAIDIISRDATGINIDIKNFKYLKPSVWYSWVYRIYMLLIDYNQDGNLDVVGLPIGSDDKESEPGLLIDTKFDFYRNVPSFSQREIDGESLRENWGKYIEQRRQHRRTITIAGYDVVLAPGQVFKDMLKDKSFISTVKQIGNIMIKKNTEVAINRAISNLARKKTRLYRSYETPTFVNVREGGYVEDAYICLLKDKDGKFIRLLVSRRESGDFLDGVMAEKMTAGLVEKLASKVKKSVLAERSKLEGLLFDIVEEMPLELTKKLANNFREIGFEFWMESAEPSKQAPVLKSSSAGYEKEIAGQIADFCERVMPNRNKAEREYIFVEYIINSVDSPNLIDYMARVSGRNSEVIKRELAEYPMLKDVINKYGTKQILPIEIRSDSPALDLMVLIARIAAQQKTDVELLTKIFFNCVKPVIFIDSLSSLEELKYVYVNDSIGAQFLKYLPTEIIWENIRAEFGVGPGATAIYPELSSLAPKSSSAGETPSFNKQVEGTKEFLRANRLSVSEHLTIDTENQTFSLNLSSTRITDINPLKDLVNLRGLYLFFTRITDISPLKDLVNLRELNLSLTRITDISPLKDLVNLRELNLSNTSITDISPLKDLVNLRELNLSSTSITDISPLKDLVNLKELYLSSTSITDISPLKDLVNLEELDLSFTNFTDISPLKDLVNLKELYLSSTSITEEQIYRLFQAHPNPEKLTVVNASDAEIRYNNIPAEYRQPRRGGESAKSSSAGEQTEVSVSEVYRMLIKTADEAKAALLSRLLTSKTSVFDNIPYGSASKMIYDEASGDREKAKRLIDEVVEHIGILARQKHTGFALNYTMIEEPPIIPSLDDAGWEFFAKNPWPDISNKALRQVSEFTPYLDQDGRVYPDLMLVKSRDGKNIVWARRDVEFTRLTVGLTLPAAKIIDAFKSSSAGAIVSEVRSIQDNPEIQGFLHSLGIRGLISYEFTGPNSEYLITIDRGERLKAYNLKAENVKEPIYECPLMRNYKDSYALSRNGNLLVTIDMLHWVDVIDLSSPETPLIRWQARDLGMPAYLELVGITWDSDAILARGIRGNQGVIFRLDMETGSVNFEPISMDEETGNVHRTKISYVRNDGEALYYIHDDPEFAGYRPEITGFLESIGACGIISYEFTGPNSEYLITIDRGERLKAYNLKAENVKEPIYECPLMRNYKDSYALSRNGNLLVTIDMLHWVDVIDLSSPETPLIRWQARDLGMPAYLELVGITWDSDAILARGIRGDQWVNYRLDIKTGSVGLLPFSMDELTGKNVAVTKSSSAGQVEFIMSTAAERLAGFFFIPVDKLNVEAIGELKAALKEQKSRLTGLGKLSCPAEDAVRAGLAITLKGYLQAIDEGERLALVNDGFNKILEEILQGKTDLKLHYYQPAETDVIGTIIINEDELQHEQKNEMVRLFSKISKYRAEAIERLGANVVLKNEYNRDEDCTPHMVAISKNPIPAAKEARLLDITIEHTPDALLPVDKGLLFAKGLLLYLATDRALEVEVKLSELYRLLRKGQGEPLQETELLDKFIDEGVFTLLLPKPERVDKEQYQKLLRLRLLTLIAA